MISTALIEEAIFAALMMPSARSSTMSRVVVPATGPAQAPTTPVVEIALTQ